VRDTSGPVSLMRYNMYAATAITGDTSPGTSSGQGVTLMQKIAGRELPRSMALDWTELTYLQLQAGNTAIYVFALAVVFVFLVLAAQYESWRLPLAVILVVPMCLLCSIVGVELTGLEVTIFTQIGFVVLVGFQHAPIAHVVACAVPVHLCRQEADRGDLPQRPIGPDFADLVCPQLQSRGDVRQVTAHQPQQQSQEGKGGQADEHAGAGQ